MNYIEQIADEIWQENWQEGDPDDIPQAERLLYRIYAVLCLTKGDDVTWSDVHDAWSAWQSETMPDHRSIIPFDELDDRVQRMDEPYARAIRVVARRRGFAQ